MGRETRPGVAQNRQGEALPEVPEEEDRLPRPRQEEEGGDAGRPPGHEEEAGCLNTFPAIFSSCYPDFSLREEFADFPSCVFRQQTENFADFPSQRENLASHVCSSNAVT